MAGRGMENDFAFSLYRRLRADAGNLFFSPLSIRLALAMAACGARGETAKQMAGVLGKPRLGTTVQAATGAAPRRLAASRGEACELVIANSIWTQQDAPLQAAFLDTVATQFGGRVTAVDFQARPQEASIAVNQWVAEATHGMIRRLIDVPDRDTRLMLANAIYFNASWKAAFHDEMTRSEMFHVAGGAPVSVPLMHGTRVVPYLEAATYRAVELAYEGDDLAMIVLLPTHERGLAELERELSAGDLDDCAARMSRQKVELFLPRFAMSHRLGRLAGHLAELGMSLPFDELRADFSGINGHRPPDTEALYVSSIAHVARVDVTERGTKAAAATAISARLRGFGGDRAPVPVFRADHPFLFAIRERSSGALLFLGRVCNPSE
jgi:serpin B